MRWKRTATWRWLIFSGAWKTRRPITSTRWRNWRGDTPLPRLTAWEFDWPEAEPPETASYEAVHYRMSLRQAVELALANEQAAEAYYRDYAAASSDQETIRVATRFAEEESGHAAELKRLLGELPENGAHLREEDDEPNMPE